MGIEAKHLERYTDRPVVGIGGKADTFVIRDAIVILGIDEGSEKIMQIKELLYHPGERYKKRKTKGAMVYEREALVRHPSILGMDLLRESELKLVVDPAREEAYLED